MEETFAVALTDRQVVPRPSWLAAGALIFAGFQLDTVGVVMLCAGLALLVDSLLLLWRSRGLTCTLSVPLAGRVGTPINFRIQLDTSSGSTISPRVGLSANDGDPRPGWIQKSGEPVDVPITPSHRGRFDQLRVTAAHRGVFGLEVLRHDFVFGGPPALSVGPVQTSHNQLQPARVTAPVKAEDQLSPTSAAEPVLRPWQLGDRTSSIDWRRFERLDELVVRASPRVHQRIIIVCDLGPETTDYEAVDYRAGQWSSLARHHLSSGQVALVWREQDATHVRLVEGSEDIDWVLAGATAGDFDSAVLDELGIDHQSATVDE